MVSHWFLIIIIIKSLIKNANKVGHVWAGHQLNKTLNIEQKLAEKRIVFQKTNASFRGEVIIEEVERTVKCIDYK